MNKYVNAITLSLIFLIGTTSTAMAFKDKIIAIVNDQLITFQDLENYIRSTFMELSTRGYSEEQLNELMDDFQKNGLQKLIEDKLILSKANEMGIEIKKQLVDDKIKEIESKYPSEQLFIQSLVDHGATLTDLRDKILDQLKIKFILEYQVRSKILINPREVTDYYNQNLDQFKEEEKVTLESIFIQSNGDKQAAMDKAQEVLRQINAKEITFSQAAKEYSDAPAIGTVTKGTMKQDIEDVVFKLKEGDISPPISVDAGIYIFQCINKQPAQITSLEQAKERIYSYLFEVKFRERLTEWLDELKNKAYIEIKQ